MTTVSSTFRFLPWTRRGLADRVTGVDAGGPIPVRPKVSVGLTITGTSEVRYDQSLYGPGDVIGVDPRLIVRTDPRPNATDVEPNYFPAIEFDAPDFPWAFTPAVSGTDNRLRPWCVLIVVDLAVVDPPRADVGHPLPVVRVPDAVRATELPDLSESWAWAHTQVLMPSTSTSSTAVGTALSTEPSMNVSRLVAPRRLEPNKRYAACLVPAFDAGVARGLFDAAPIDGMLNPAWSATTPGDVRLPVYFHWEFSTGAAGDFESLARRLKPVEAPDTAGVEPMYVGSAGPDLPVIAPDDAAAYLDMDGPLRAPRRKNAWLGEVPDAVQSALAATLDATATVVQGGAVKGTPAFGPPIYGQWHAEQHTVSDAAPGWLRDLNLDPRARAAAGLGAEIVRQHQDDFVQWSWEQVGRILEANDLLSQSRLSLEALTRVHARHVATLPADRALQFAAPMHSRVAAGPTTLRGAIEQSSLPNAAGDPALRRLTSPRHRLIRSAIRHAPPPPGTLSTSPPPAPPQPPRIVAQLASSATNTDPARFMPSGIAGMPEMLGWGYNIVFPSLSESVLGFGIVTGISGTQIQSIQTTTQAAMTAPIPPAPPIIMSMTTGAPATAPAPQPTPQFVSFAVSAARDTFVERTVPGFTVPARLQGMLSVGGAAMQLQRVAARAGAPLPAQQRSPIALSSSFDRIMAAPELDVPVYAYLASLDASRFMPGVGDLPNDSIMLLETNPRFIEALLVGLNTEMNRELLWRDFPTDQRGTPFKRFWNWSDGGADISPIHTWSPTSALGANARAGSGGQIVLLIRGRLLKRYPNTAIYAWRASGARLKNPPAATDIRKPAFAGTLGTDIAFAGFDLTDADLTQGDGWFFVLQEQPTEPRFGFDEGTGAPKRVLTAWSDVSWDDVGTESGRYLRIAGNPLSGITIGGARFVDHAAHLAFITIQQPTCVALHAHTIVASATS